LPDFDAHHASVADGKMHHCQNGLAAGVREERSITVNHRVRITLALTLLPLLAVAAFFAWIGLGGSSARLLIPLPEPLRPPELALRDGAGEIHTLSEFSGRVVIVHFWAAWCEPCRREIASLSAFADRFASDGVVLLALHVGESPEALPRFLREQPIAGLVLQDPESVAFNAWGAKGVPTTYIVGRDGLVHSRSNAEVDWLDAHTAREIGILSATKMPGLSY
jgi:thiol-disulfide isomerase/thioredoxin